MIWFVLLFITLAALSVALDLVDWAQHAGKPDRRRPDQSGEIE